MYERARACPRSASTWLFRAEVRVFGTGMETNTCWGNALAGPRTVTVPRLVPTPQEELTVAYSD